MFKLFPKKLTRKFCKKKTTKSAYRRINSQSCLLTNISVREEEGNPAPESPGLAIERPDYHDHLNKSYAPFSPFVLSFVDDAEKPAESFRHFTFLPNNFYKRFIQLLPQADYHTLIFSSSTMYKICLENRGIEIDELTIDNSYQTNFPPICISRNRLALYRCQRFISSPLFPFLRIMDSLKITIDDSIEISDLLQLSDSLQETYTNIFLKISSKQNNLSALSTLFHKNVQRTEITINETVESWDELLIMLNDVSHISIFDWSAEKMDKFKLLKAKIQTWISCRASPLESFEFAFLPKETDMKKMKKFYYFKD